MILDHIDLAQVAIWGFWLFFAVLIYYLQTENMREGYPLETDEGESSPNQGPFPLPSPKTFILPHGRGEKTVPDYQPEDRVLPLEKTSPTQGFPFTPVGDPMEGGVGPASWAPRRDVPELDGKGHPKILPMRHLEGFRISAGNDPRGLPVQAADGGVVGTISDMWIDEPEHLVRYLEVDLREEDGGGTRLIPIHFAKVRADRVRVRSLFPQHFAGIPRVKSDRQITLLEEEKITAWFGGGTMYAHPSRMGS